MVKKKVEFTPANKKQAEFLFSDAEELLMSGAAGATKSFSGLLKGIILNLKYPGNKGLVCRKDFKSLKQSTLRTLKENILPDDMIIEWSEGKGVIRHKTSNPEFPESRIIISGLDKRADQSYPTKIGSTEFGWIFIDEMVEIDEGDYEMLLSRLRFQIPSLTKKENDKVVKPIFGATNPGPPSHWIYQRFIDQDPEELKELGREVVYMTPWDNPYLPEDYIQKKLSGMTGVRKQRLLYGKWVAAEGVIYKHFDREKHVVEDESVFLDDWNDYKRIIVGADANYPKPRAWYVIGVRSEERKDVLAEFYNPESHVEDAINWLVDLKERKGFKNSVTVYHDPSDPGAIDKIKSTSGVVAVKADNKVQPGISEVSRHFSNNLLKISPRCNNLIRELESYRWKPGYEDEQPEKEDDHACDALRYALFSMRGTGGGITFLYDDSGTVL